MAASMKTTPNQGWLHDPHRWDELPTDGSHAWLGLLLVLGSSVVAVRGLCWVMAQMIRASHPF